MALILNRKWKISQQEAQDILYIVLCQTQQEIPELLLIKQQREIPTIRL